MGQNIKRSKNGSVKIKSISFSTYSKRVRIISIATALATMLATGIVLKSKNALKELAYQNSVDSSVSTIVMNDKPHKTLLSEYSYRVGNGENFAYNLSGVASELVKCSPEDFDVILFSVYNDMQYKGNNWDDLFQCLNIAVSHVKDDNPELYLKLKDINSFDDYLRKLNLLDSDGAPSREKYVKYGRYLNELQKDALKHEAKEKKSEEKSGGKRY